MQNEATNVEPQTGSGATRLLVGMFLVAAVAFAGILWKLDSSNGSAVAPTPPASSRLTPETPLNYERRRPLDVSGLPIVLHLVEPWKSTASLTEISGAFKKVAIDGVAQIDVKLAGKDISDEERFSMLMSKAFLCGYQGDAKRAYQTLKEGRLLAETNESLYAQSLPSLMVFQGIYSLRQGENENCILCRGESSCILPISRAAIHTNPEGSRRAIHHFTEYLTKFPDDLEVRWLLNLAHMTLGEYPDKVDPRYLVSIDHYLKSEFNIGKFRDIGDKVGVNRLNQAGGSIMDDFDNDGLLDIVTTTMDATEVMTFYHNDGQGKFENRAAAAGLDDQLGGLNCMQTDYNNDGYLDVFIVRGAWWKYPIRTSLLRNNQDGTFTDVTEEAGLLHPVNSITASWADYDNDGWLDLFVACEKQPSRLYKNLRNGRFEDVTESAGVYQSRTNGKGIAWGDFDNDDDPDLYLNFLTPDGGPQLYRNNGNGTFTDVTKSAGIDGPVFGFSCWAFDYDNDGWLDIFSTCYERGVDDAIRGLQGKPNRLNSNRVYHNRQGRGFEDVAHEVGLDMLLFTMGSNYGDFDNDGFLDMYLGTGEPSLSTLVPNRMFKNVAGRRFSEITASTGTGNLQKGHGVSCGDWDRDGNVDIFIEMGGALPGDKYHNILFQNPGGHGNNWLTVKLIGEESNRAAIGTRIKVVTAGKEPQTIHRHVSSGSSFGGNPLQQTIGLGTAKQIAILEIHWPKSNSTQVFRDVDVNQAIEITEFAKEFRPLNWKPVPVPK